MFSYFKLLLLAPSILNQLHSSDYNEYISYVSCPSQWLFSAIHSFPPSGPDLSVFLSLNFYQLKNPTTIGLQ